MNIQTTLFAFWGKLEKTKQLKLLARSYAQTETGWKGNGSVLVIKESDTTLVFHEKGFWETQGIAFTNTLRWTLDKKGGRISLEHLRFGSDAPVFLLHLVPIDNNTLISTDPHLCGKDTYAAQATWDQEEICLRWQITGPRKNETMEYRYK